MQGLPHRGRRPYPADSEDQSIVSLPFSPRGYSGSMATRRAFMAGALAVIAAPLAAQENKAGRGYRIRVLESGSLSHNAGDNHEISKGVRDLRYVEGPNPP